MPSITQQISLDKNNEYTLQSSSIPVSDQDVMLFDFQQQIAKISRHGTYVAIECYTDRQMNLFGEIQCEKFEVTAKGNLCLDVQTDCKQIHCKAASLTSFQPVTCDQLALDVENTLSLREGKITVHEQFTVKTRQFDQNAEIIVEGKSFLQAERIESSQDMSLHQAAVVKVNQWRFNGLHHYLLTAENHDQVIIQHCHISADADVIFRDGHFNFHKVICSGHMHLQESKQECERFTLKDKATLTANNSSLASQHILINAESIDAKNFHLKGAVASIRANKGLLDQQTVYVDTLNLDGNLKVTHSQFDFATLIVNGCVALDYSSCESLRDGMHAHSIFGELILDNSFFNSNTDMLVKADATLQVNGAMSSKDVRSLVVRGVTIEGKIKLQDATIKSETFVYAGQFFSARDSQMDVLNESSFDASQEAIEFFHNKLKTGDFNLKGHMKSDHSSMTAVDDFTILMNSRLSGNDNDISAGTLRCDGEVDVNKTHFSVDRDMHVNHAFTIEGGTASEIKVDGNFHLATTARATINSTMAIEGNANIDGHLFQSDACAMAVAGAVNTAPSAIVNLVKSQVKARKFIHSGELHSGDTQLQIDEEFNAAKYSKIKGAQLAITAEKIESHADTNVTRLKFSGEECSNAGDMHISDFTMRCNYRAVNNGSIVVDTMEVVAPLWFNKHLVTINKSYITHTLMEEPGCLTVKGTQDRHTLLNAGHQYSFNVPNPVEMIKATLQDPIRLYPLVKYQMDSYLKKEVFDTVSLLMAFASMSRHLWADQNKIKESYARYCEKHQKTDQNFLSNLNDYLFHLPRHEYLSFFWEVKRAQQEMRDFYSMTSSRESIKKAVKEVRQSLPINWETFRNYCSRQSLTINWETFKNYCNHLSRQDLYNAWLNNARFFLPLQSEEGLATCVVGYQGSSNHASYYFINADNTVANSVYTRQTATYRLFRGVGAAFDSEYKSSAMLNGGVIYSHERAQMTVDRLDNAGTIELQKNSKLTTTQSFNNSDTVKTTSLETRGEKAANSGTVSAKEMIGTVKSFSNTGKFSASHTEMKTTAWENKGEFHSTKNTKINADKMTLAKNSTNESRGGIVSGRELIGGEKSESLIQLANQQMTSGATVFVPAAEFKNDPTNIVAEDVGFVFDDEIFLAPNVTLHSQGKTALKSGLVTDFSRTDIEGSHTVDAGLSVHFGKFTGNRLNYTSSHAQFAGSSDIRTLHVEGDGASLLENQNYQVSGSQTATFDIDASFNLTQNALGRNIPTTLEGVDRIGGPLQTTASLSISSNKKLPLNYPISAGDLRITSPTDIINTTSPAASGSLTIEAGGQYIHQDGTLSGKTVVINADSVEFPKNATGQYPIAAESVMMHTRTGDITLKEPVSASRHVAITQENAMASLNVVSHSSLYTVNKPTQEKPTSYLPGNIYIYQDLRAKTKTEREKIWMLMVPPTGIPSVREATPNELSKDDFRQARHNKHFSSDGPFAQKIRQLLFQETELCRGSIHGGDGQDHNGIGLLLNAGYVNLQGNPSLTAIGDIDAKVTGLTANTPDIQTTTETTWKPGKSALQRGFEMDRGKQTQSQTVHSASMRSVNGAIHVYATHDIAAQSLNVTAPGDKTFTAVGSITMESTVTTKSTIRAQIGNGAKQSFSRHQQSTPVELSGGGKTLIHANGPINLTGIRVTGPDGNKGKMYVSSDTSVTLDRTRLQHEKKRRFLETSVFINGFEVSKPLMSLFHHSHLSKEQWLDAWHELVAHEPMVKVINDCMNSENIYETLAKSWNAGVEGLEALNALATCINTQSATPLIQRAGFDSLEITTKTTLRIQHVKEQTLAPNETVEQQGIYIQAPSVFIQGGIAWHAHNQLGLSANTVSCSASRLPWHSVAIDYSLTLGFGVLGVSVGLDVGKESHQGHHNFAPTLTSNGVLIYDANNLSGTVRFSASQQAGRIGHLSLVSVPDDERNSQWHFSASTSGRFSANRSSGYSRTMANGAACLQAGDASDLSISMAELTGSSLLLPGATIGHVTTHSLKKIGRQYRGFGLSANPREWNAHENQNLFNKAEVRVDHEDVRQKQRSVVTGATIQSVTGNLRTTNDKGLKTTKESSFHSSITVPFTSAKKLRAAKDNFQAASEKILNFLLPEKELSYLDRVYLLNEMKRNMEAEVRQLTDNGHSPLLEEMLEATQETAKQKSDPLKKPTVSDLIARGLEDSSLNALAQSESASHLDMSELDVLDRLTYNFSSLAGDMPVIIATGKAVGFFTKMFAHTPWGMVMTVAGGAAIFAAPALIRESHRAYKEYKNAHPGTSFSFNTFLKEHGLHILKEVGHAALIGAITTTAGMVGAQWLAPAAHSSKLLVPHLTKAQVIAEKAGEAVAMGTVPDLLHGELPTGQTMLDTGLLLSVANGASAGGRFVKNRVAFNRNQSAYYALPVTKSIGKCERVFARHFEGSVPVYAEGEEALSQAKIPIEVAFNGENGLATDCLLNTAEHAKNGDSFLLFQNTLTVGEGEQFHATGVKEGTKMDALTGRETESGKRFVLIAAKNTTSKVYKSLSHEAHHNGHANTYGDSCNPYFPANHEAPEQWDRARQVDIRNRLNNPPGTAAEKACHVMASVSESHYARATRDAESAAYIAESSAVDDAYTRKIVPEQVKLLEESLVNVRENTRLAPVKHMLEKILPSLTDAQKNAVSHTLTAALEARGMQGNLFDNRQDMRSSYTFRHDVIQEARRNQSAIKNAIVTQDPVLLESTCNKIAEAVYQKITEANELVPLHIPFTSEGNSSIEEEKPCVALSNSRDALYGHVSGQTAHSRVSDSVTVVSENQKKTSHKIP